MAPLSPSASDFRWRVRCDRRAVVPDDGLGNTEGPFEPFVTGVAAIIESKGGDEETRQGATAVIGKFDITVRVSAATLQFTEGDVLVDERDPRRVFNVQWIGDRTGRYLTMACTSGGARD